VGRFQFFTKICEDIHNFVFIAGINDTGDKLFTGVSYTGDKLPLVVATGNKLLPLLLTPGITPCPKFSRIL
jgi:hypothetical protein